MKRPQAIAGVSPQHETLIEEFYPSLAATPLGRFLDSLYESMPYGLGRLKLSYVLFIPPTLPVVALAYFYMKIAHGKYVLTNRALKHTTLLGGRLLAEVPLLEIQEVAIDERSRGRFFPVADVVVTRTQSDSELILRGMPYPDRVVQVIVEAREARRQVGQALQTIERRHQAVR
ncbi:MAG: hypothetical protein KatS3mg114_0019 [Planctomycetaceae bacterium]|nr:MAG: hypothetical protein KatS3mg114_0019 [Planctomycetaceae bacterium]